MPRLVAPAWQRTVSASTAEQPLPGNTLSPPSLISTTPLTKRTTVMSLTRPASAATRKRGPIRSASVVACAAPGSAPASAAAEQMIASLVRATACRP